MTGQYMLVSLQQEWEEKKEWKEDLEILSLSLFKTQNERTEFFVIVFSAGKEKSRWHDDLLVLTTGFVTSRVVDGRTSSMKCDLTIMTFPTLLSLVSHIEEEQRRKWLQQNHRMMFYQPGDPRGSSSNNERERTHTVTEQGIYRTKVLSKNSYNIMLLSFVSWSNKRFPLISSDLIYRMEFQDEHLLVKTMKETRHDSMFFFYTNRGSLILLSRQWSSSDTIMADGETSLLSFLSCL